MELTNEFVIDRGVEDTWKILNDLEFIAPCMPGAQLQEIEGDEYRGIVKVKVGPITAQYKGKASFVEQDAAKKVARLKAEGRDPRQGNANAMITASMSAAGANQTTVTIHTDLGLSGKIASFGRGAIEDVSKKILGQFTENLRLKLENEGTGDSNGSAPVASSAATAAEPAEAEAPAASEPSGAAPSPAEASTSSSAAPSGPAASTPTIRRIDSPEAEPVDLLAVTQGPMVDAAKKAALPVGVVLLLLFLLRWLRGRG